jgi:hypothetical protein
MDTPYWNAHFVHITEKSRLKVPEFIRVDENQFLFF